uniref:NADH-ubiquinone oxidoreductase chain 1 n=1 Tax=Tanakia himantegus TaxID=481777 RepID=A0A0U1ZWC2_9TELE|nr:NADH dehydrogenase subunit 1 [Tanakia himantegus]AKE35883.1 NADH dehydrogenase subunit 1 [Tanakia himantegus]
MLITLMTHLINPLGYIVPILLAVAFLTLVERKVLGYMQLRKNPNVVGPYNLLQPIVDGVKLFIKELVRLSTSFPFLFLAAPILAPTLAMMLRAPMPKSYPVIDLNLGMLFILALSSLAAYSILGSGWAPNWKYALIGTLRAVAQTISYEISLGLVLLSMIIFSGGYTLRTFNVARESIWLLTSAWPLAAMCNISTLAETNWALFDLTEGGSELVSGLNVEYAGGLFALPFLAEYAIILLMNTHPAVLFLGSSLIPNVPELMVITLMTKAAPLSILFSWVRASYPRFRCDQLMHLAWKDFLPFTLALVLWYIALPIALTGLPPQL